MLFTKDDIKNNLTIEQIADLVAELGGEPIRNNGLLMCRTICHGGSSHKLYYYDNTKLFRCYTDCPEPSFDVFELLIKVHALDNETWTLYNAMSFVANFFALNFDDDFTSQREKLQDWQLMSKWQKNSEVLDMKKTVELQVFDNKILQNLPHVKFRPWLAEGISYEICESRGICYDPLAHGIVIPHYDIDGNLIGIRERTLIKENEKDGKYKPAFLNGKLYNHPLSFNLYNLNFSKENIKTIKKAVVFESEKSCLKMASFFGTENDISVACCGSNFINYQFQLLNNLGVSEIIVAFDRQYQQIGSEEWKRWTHKLTDIHKKYGKYTQISFLFDKGYTLPYKAAPIDLGPEVFLQLYNNRIFI